MTFQVSDVCAWVAPTIVLGNLEAWRPSVETDSVCVLEKTIITILACVSCFIWFLLSTQNLQFINSLLQKKLFNFDQS